MAGRPQGFIGRFGQRCVGKWVLSALLACLVVMVTYRAEIHARQYVRTVKKPGGVETSLSGGPRNPPQNYEVENKPKEVPVVPNVKPNQPLIKRRPGEGKTADHNQESVAIAAANLLNSSPEISDDICKYPDDIVKLSKDNMCSFAKSGAELPEEDEAMAPALNKYEPFEKLYRTSTCKFHKDVQKTPKYFNCLPSTSEKFEVKADATKYYHSDGPGTGCFKEGTEKVEGSGVAAKCVCKTEYTGESCSYPPHVTVSDYPMSAFKPKPLANARKLIVLFPFNVEFEVLELRFAATADVVDAFFILESNFTAFGEPRPQYLERLLNRGFLWEHQHKIVRVFLDYFPANGRINGWEVDSLLRNYISQSAMPRCISGLNDDDWLISFDGDEVMSRESMLFLKLHSNVPYPASVDFRLYKYGFFWIYPIRWHLSGASTVEFVNKCLDKMVHNARHFDEGKIGAITKKSAACADLRGQIKRWHFGTQAKPGGWHCSHCGSPQRAQLKDHSVHVGESQHHERFYRDTGLYKYVNRYRVGQFYGKKQMKGSCPLDDTAVPLAGDISKLPQLYVNLAVLP